MYAPNHWKWKTSGMASKLYCEFTAQFVLHTTYSLLLSFTFEFFWPILQQRNDLSNDRFHASRSHFHVTQTGKAQMRNYILSTTHAQMKQKRLRARIVDCHIENQGQISSLTPFPLCLVMWQPWFIVCGSRNPEFWKCVTFFRRVSERRQGR